MADDAAAAAEAIGEALRSIRNAFALEWPVARLPPPFRLRPATADEEALFSSAESKRADGPGMSRFGGGPPTASTALLRAPTMAIPSSSVSASSSSSSSSSHTPSSGALGAKEAVTALPEALHSLETLIEAHALADLVDPLRSLRARHAGLTAGLKTLRRQLSTYEGSQRSEIAGQRQSAAVEQLDAALKAREAEVGSLGASLKAARDKLEEETAICAQRRRDAEDTTDVEAKIDAARERRDRAQAEAEALQETIERARQQLEDVEAVARTLRRRSGGAGAGGGGAQTPGSTAKRARSRRDSLGDEDEWERRSLEEEERRLRDEIGALEKRLVEGSADLARAWAAEREHEERQVQREIAEATRVAEANEGQTATLQAVRRWLDSAMARTVAECARLGSFRAELLRVLHERGGQLPLSTLKDALAGKEGVADVTKHVYKLVGARFLKMDRSSADTLITALVG